jgi:hypothetical protein
LLPQAGSDSEWVYAALVPPLPLFACAVDVVVMNGAKRDSELIAHL